MFWTFTLVATLAAALIKLGSATTTVVFLTAGLHASAILVVILAVLLLWKSRSTGGKPSMV